MYRKKIDFSSCAWIDGFPIFGHIYQNLVRLAKFKKNYRPTTMGQQQTESGYRCVIKTHGSESRSQGGSTLRRPLDKRM